MTLAEAEAAHEAAWRERDDAVAAYNDAWKRKNEAADRLKRAAFELDAARTASVHQRLPAPVWIDRPSGRDVDHRVYTVEDGGVIVLRNMYRYRSRYNPKTGYLYGARGQAKADGGRLDVAATLRALGEVTP